MSNQPGYKSFLLRLWRVHSSTGSSWRASLEDPHTGVRLGFSGIRQLHEFLFEETDDTQTPDNQHSTSDSSSIPAQEDPRQTQQSPNDALESESND